MSSLDADITFSFIVFYRLWLLLITVGMVAWLVFALSNACPTGRKIRDPVVVRIILFLLWTICVSFFTTVTVNDVF